MRNIFSIVSYWNLVRGPTYLFACGKRTQKSKMEEFLLESVSPENVPPNMQGKESYQSGIRFSQPGRGCLVFQHPVVK